MQRLSIKCFINLLNSFLLDNLHDSVWNGDKKSNEPFINS
jgi:hypothetical protein